MKSINNEIYYIVQKVFDSTKNKANFVMQEDLNTDFEDDEDKELIITKETPEDRKKLKKKKKKEFVVGLIIAISLINPVGILIYGPYALYNRSKKKKEERRRRKMEGKSLENMTLDTE